MISNDIKYKVPVCPKCLQFPFFQLSFHQPGIININCDCGYHSSLLIHNYLLVYLITSMYFYLNINIIRIVGIYKKCFLLLLKMHLLYSSF